MRTLYKAGRVPDSFSVERFGRGVRDGRAADELAGFGLPVEGSDLGYTKVRRKGELRGGPEWELDQVRATGG